MKSYYVKRFPATAFNDLNVSRDDEGYYYIVKSGECVQGPYIQRIEALKVICTTVRNKEYAY